MFKSLLKLGLFSSLLLVLAAGLSWRLLNNYLDTPMFISSPTSYQLKRGGSLSTVLAWLSDNRYLAYPRLVSLYSRISGEGSQVLAGEYLLEPKLTPRALLKKLSEGEVVYYPITFVEGKNLRQLTDQLSAQSGLSHSSADDLKGYIKQLSAEYPSAEGLFFPDTYHFYNGMGDTELLEQSFVRMQLILATEWGNRAVDLPYQNAYEALIMASLIEKETGVAYERGQIAGVFVRRLEQKMRLQTDPTVIYGLGESFDGNLRSRHLKDASNPYNTYRHHGLPPSPIAMPGKGAIVAALHPEAGDSLYFVAKGDGSHYFSATLAEHNRAVRKYQIYQRKKKYTSRPGK